MLYSFWLLFLIVYVFGYKFIIRTSGEAAVVINVEPIKVVSTNKNVVRYTRECNTRGRVTNIQKVIDERKQKIDLREQYESWKENARLVDEYYKREHAPQMRSG